jgi:hypothetical protein
MNRQAILSTKYILDLLNDNTDLTSIVGDRIFPLDATQSTAFPFIVIQRDNIVINYLTKDQYVNDEAVVSIYVVSQSYLQAVNIAQLVRLSLERKHNDVIEDIKFTGAQESYYNNSFVQVLNFNIEYK